MTFLEILMPKHVLRFNRCLNKSHIWRFENPGARRTRNKKCRHFEIERPGMGGVWFVVVESDRFDVQKLFQRRLAGTSAG